MTSYSKKKKKNIISINAPARHHVRSPNYRNIQEQERIKPIPTDRFKATI